MPKSGVFYTCAALRVSNNALRASEPLHKIPKIDAVILEGLEFGKVLEILRRFHFRRDRRTRTIAQLDVGYGLATRFGLPIKAGKMSFHATQSKLPGA